MNQIDYCDWLPEQAIWSYLAHLETTVSREKNSDSVHKHAKKNLANIQAT